MNHGYIVPRWQKKKIDEGQQLEHKKIDIFYHVFVNKPVQIMRGMLMNKSQSDLKMKWPARRPRENIARQKARSTSAAMKVDQPRGVVNKVWRAKSMTSEKIRGAAINDVDKRVEVRKEDVGKEPVKEPNEKEMEALEWQQLKKAPYVMCRVSKTLHFVSVMA